MGQRPRLRLHREEAYARTRPVSSHGPTVRRVPFPTNLAEPRGAVEPRSEDRLSSARGDSLRAAAVPAPSPRTQSRGPGAWPAASASTGRQPSATVASTDRGHPPVDQPVARTRPRQDTRRAPPVAAFAGTTPAHLQGLRRRCASADGRGVPLPQMSVDAISKRGPTGSSARVSTRGSLVARGLESVRAHEDRCWRRPLHHVSGRASPPPCRAIADRRDALPRGSGRSVWAGYLGRRVPRGGRSQRRRCVRPSSPGRRRP